MGLVVHAETDGHVINHLPRAMRMAVWTGGVDDGVDIGVDAGVDMGVVEGCEQQCGQWCKPEVWTWVWTRRPRLRSATPDKQWLCLSLWLCCWEHTSDANTVTQSPT